MAFRRVKRIALSGSEVKLLFGRNEVPALSASYGDKIDTEALRRMGSQTIDARTSGTYATEDCKVKVEEAVWRDDVQKLLGQGYGRVNFPLIVQWGHPDMGYDTDLLAEARIVGVSESAENSAKASEVEFTIVFDQLYRTNRRLTINLDPDVNPGANRLN